MVLISVISLLMEVVFWILAMHHSMLLLTHLFLLKAPVLLLTRVPRGLRCPFGLAIALVPSEVP
jgi:hypothetical protein